MKSKSIRLAAVLCVLGLLSPFSYSRGSESGQIGTIHFARADVERTLEGTGLPVESGAPVRTESTLGVVHLDNGQVFKLDPNSAARFEVLPYDEVQVTVLSGRLSKWSGKGRVLTAGAGSRFVAGRSVEDPMAQERALLHDGAPEGGDAATATRELGR